MILCCAISIKKQFTPNLCLMLFFLKKHQQSKIYLNLNYFKIIVFAIDIDSAMYFSNIIHPVRLVSRFKFFKRVLGYATQ